MLKKRLQTIGVFTALICFGGGQPTRALAQGGCTDCGQGGYVESGELAEFGAATFEQNVGNGQPADYPGCGDGSCAQVCCPAVCCGPYISIFGGWSTFDNFSREQILVPSQAVIPGLTEFRDFGADDGYGVGFAIGRQVHARARVELDFSYRQNDMDSYRIQQFADVPNTSDTILANSIDSPAVGDFESYALMGNFVYDFSPRCIRKFNLYTGAGLGIIGVNGTATTATNFYDINDSTFAYQIIGGINRPVNQRLDIFTEYRFMSASAITVNDQTLGVSLGKFDFNSNNLFFGIRLRH